MLKLLGLLGAMTSIFAFTMPVYYARKTAGYSARFNTLSELGETGSPHQKSVSRFYFLPLSIAIIIFVLFGQSAISFLSQETLVWALLGLVGVGYLIAALFPCDRGSPIGGSVSNQIHNVAGLFEYLGSGLGLTLMGVLSYESSTSPQMALYLILSGSVILLSLVMLLLPSFGHIRGAVQRLAEASFFTWMLTISLMLLLGDS